MSSKNACACPGTCLPRIHSLFQGRWRQGKGNKHIGRTGGEEYEGAGDGAGKVEGSGGERPVAARWGLGQMNLM